MLRSAERIPGRQVYSRIAALVELADYQTVPLGLLRADGTLFLAVNMGAMIVIPRQRELYAERLAPSSPASKRRASAAATPESSHSTRNAMVST
jgi:hypothetical protein